MEVYGSYEVKRTISTARGCVVHAACLAGSSGREEFAVKVFSPTDFIGGETTIWRRDSLGEGGRQRTYAGPELFLKAVQKQEQTQASGAKHVAAIHASGQDERGAYYVTNYYSRSLKKIIDGRVSLTAAACYHLIDSILSGALEYKSQGGSGHGNIKPANVLIGRRGQVDAAEVVLTDPLPDGEAESAKYESADLRSVGEIIYHLVRRREVSGASNWPVLPGPEWTEMFGEAADPWRELCNTLLDPNLATAGLSLEVVQERLRKLKPRRPVSMRLVGLSGAGVVLVGVGAWLVISMVSGSKYGKIEIDSVPSGAEVWTADGVFKQKTPYLLTDLEPSELYYVLKLADHYDYPLKTNVVAGEFTQVTVPLQHHQGTVNLSSDLPGVRYFMGTNYLGETVAVGQPLKVKLDTGRLEIIGRYPTLSDQTNSVEVERDQEKPSPFSVPRSTFRLASQPTGAAVWLGERQVGVTPMTNFFDPGPISLELRAAGFNTERVSTNLLAGQDAEVAVTLFEGNATVELTSVPPGAEVLWNDQLMGITPPSGPLRFELPRGRHDLVVRYRELKPQTVRVDLEKDEIEQQQVSLPFGGLVITSEPNGADVFYELSRVGQTPYTNQFVDPGERSYEVKRDQQSERVTVFVTENQIYSTNVVLSFGEGFLALRSDPPGAEFFAGSVSLGKTPLATGAPLTAGPFPKGTIQVVGRYPGLDDQEEWLEVLKDQTNQQTVAFVYGNVSLTSTPADATVLVGEKRIGQTPLPLQRFLKPGPVEYELQAEDYLNQIARIQVPTNGTVVTNITLVPGQGTLVLLAEAAGAQAFTNNTLMGSLPLTNSLSIGQYEVVVRLPSGSQSSTNLLRVRKGMVTLTNFVFEAATPSVARQGDFTNTVGIALVWLGPPAGYWVGRYEVTRTQYQNVMNTDPSRFKDDPELPVQNVSWSDAVEYCRRLTNLESSAGVIPSGARYTLPSLEQWSFLTAQKNWDAAVIGGPLRGQTRPERVGSKGEHGLGLYDVLGNVWELCRGPNGGALRKGASWKSSGRSEGFGSLSVAKDLKDDETGFRVVLVPASATLQ